MLLAAEGGGDATVVESNRNAAKADYTSVEVLVRSAERALRTVGFLNGDYATLGTSSAQLAGLPSFAPVALREKRAALVRLRDQRTRRPPAIFAGVETIAGVETVLKR